MPERVSRCLSHQAIQSILVSAMQVVRPKGNLPYQIYTPIACTVAYSDMTAHLNPKERRASGVLITPPPVSLLVAGESREE